MLTTEADALIEQALQTYEWLTRRLDLALDQQNKFPPRGRRTTAHAALQGRIDRLRTLQGAAYARYNRRKLNARLRVTEQYL
jgi:hypothetical protein